MFRDFAKKYKHYKTILEIEKRVGLGVGIYSILMRKYKVYKQKRRAFEIGKRAAKGYNMYLTFGSSKTITKDAQDSYNRYSMAMKHYGQLPCDESYFTSGYNKVKNNSKRSKKLWKM